MKGTVGDRIDEMVRRIVEEFDPERIILFGSHARGEAGPDSDVDLLVVMPVDGSKAEKEKEMDRTLDDVRVADHVIVVTPEEVEKRRNIPGTIVRPALLEGKALYSRKGEERLGEEDCSMPDPDEVIKVIREWVERAEEDLTMAELGLPVREKCPLGGICYHAQQCVEKYLKSLLVLKGIDFEKTHIIAEIVELLPATARPPLSPEEQRTLTRYAAFTRYPGGGVSLTRDGAEEAVSVARRVREAARALLPNEALGE